MRAQPGQDFFVYSSACFLAEFCPLPLSVLNSGFFLQALKVHIPPPLPPQLGKDLNLQAAVKELKELCPLSLGGLYPKSDLGCGIRGCLCPEEKDLGPQQTYRQIFFGGFAGSCLAVHTLLEAGPDADLGSALFCWRVQMGPYYGHHWLGCGRWRRDPGGEEPATLGRAAVLVCSPFAHCLLHTRPGIQCLPHTPFLLILTQILCSRNDHPSFVCVCVWLCHTACGILVPRPGIEPLPPALEAWRPNPWTAREFPPPPPPFCRKENEAQIV